MRYSTNSVLGLGCYYYYYYLLAILSLLLFPSNLGPRVLLVQAQTVGDHTWQLLLNTQNNPEYQPLAVSDIRSSNGVFVNNLLVMYGGDMPVYTPPYAWVYDLTTNAWLNNTAFISQLTLIGGGSSPYNPASVAVGGKVWSFGGSYSGLCLSLAIAQIFDPATWTWIQQGLTTPPSDRAGHSAVYDPVSGFIYMYGGTGCPGPVNNDLWKVSTSTFGWTMVNPSLVSIPVAYYQDWYDVYSRSWYIFGGRNSGGVDQDQFFVYFTANESFSYLPSTGSRPLQFSYLFPKLPYTRAANGLASSVAKIGLNPLIDYYPTWDAATGIWSNISTITFNPQFGYGHTVTRPVGGNAYQVYFYDPPTATVWQLLPNNNSTGGAFITSKNSEMNARDVLVTFPTNEPTIALTPKDDAGSPVVGKSSSIGFGDITELDPNGTEVATVVINEQTLNLVASLSPSGTETYVFQTADKSIQLEFSVLLNDTTFISGSIPFLVSQNAVKLAISISDWSFASASNILRVRLPYTTPFLRSVVAVDNSSLPDDLLIFSLTDDGSQAYTVKIRCLTVAEINGTQTPLLKVDIVDYNNGTGSVELFFPQFSSSLRYDPDFSVTVQGNSESDNSDDTTLIIALSVGLGAGIPVVACLLFLLILGITMGCTFYQRRKFREANSTGNVSF